VTHSDAGFGALELLAIFALGSFLAVVAAPILADITLDLRVNLVLTDAVAVRRAALDLRIQGQPCPDTGVWGAMPAQLHSRLGSIPFSRDGVTYLWWAPDKHCGLALVGKGQSELLQRVVARWDGLAYRVGDFAYLVIDRDVATGSGR